jgi:hypothetical protein
MIENFNPLPGQFTVELLARRIRIGRTLLQVENRDLEGCDGSGQMIPASSWDASMMAATRRLGPMP